MIKIICSRIERYLLIEDFTKYPNFNKKVRPKILNLINDIYPKIDERKSLLKIIKDNSLVIKISMLPILFILFGGIIGHELNQNKINYLTEKNHSIVNVANHFYKLNETHKENLELSEAQVDSMMQYFQSREWKEFIIYKEASIKVPSYLPDSIFYIMEDCRIKNDIPNFIYWRLINKESTFKMDVYSSAGAFGYMQVMPGTFGEYKNKLNLKGGHSIRNNIEVGSYLLAEHYCRFTNMGIYSDKKCWRLALSSYNAGYGNVIKAGFNVPNFNETKNYVKYILKNYRGT